MIGDLYELKSAADAAFKEGKLDDAASLYGELVSLDPTSAPNLCNHSVVALKCGQPEQALQSAERAVQLLSLQQAQGDATCHPQLAKAFHRKAQALVGLGGVIGALRVYRQGLAACQGCEDELLGALRITTEQLPPSWLAKYWGRLVEEAQAPHPLSSRDGRLIKTIPPERRLAPQELQCQLEGALAEEEDLQEEARDLMCVAWGRGRKPGKAEAAFFRAVAYQRSGNQQQALKDIKMALVYGPQASPEGGDMQLVVARGDADAPAVAQEVPCWPAAMALQSAAHEALGENLPAALCMCKALELLEGAGAPAPPRYQEALERLLRRIPEEHARVLQEKGSAGLEAWLAADKEQRLPEFLRKRPKYYYYYEWMRKRITEQYPALPDPVMDKLLTIEANELDLILQYPQATRQTVERVLGVYREHGEQYLETYRLPLLSWEEVKALKGPDTTGLPLTDTGFGGLMDMPGGQPKPPAALLSSATAPVPAIANAADAAGSATPALPPAGASSATTSSTSGVLYLSTGVDAAQVAGRGGEEAAQCPAPGGDLRSHSIALSDDGCDARSNGSESVEDMEEFSDLYELD